MAEELLTLTFTLKQLSELDKYNYWIYEQIQKDLGNNLLEVGAGTGNITRLLCHGNRSVMATDVVPSYRRELNKLFATNNTVSIGEFDLTKEAPFELSSSPFDTVVCLNVLEHIEDDIFALEQMHSVLNAKGKLCLLVPAHQFLYGEFDKAVGHFRRYAKRELNEKLTKVGFSITKMNYFSSLATVPWLINGRLLKRNYLPNEQVGLANRLVPIMKMERYFGPPFGLSLIAIAEKQA